jgi:hypothetical protein
MACLLSTHSDIVELGQTEIIEGSSQDELMTIYKKSLNSSMSGYKAEESTH